MKLYHNLGIALLLFSSFYSCCCAGSFKTRIEMHECVHICSPLVPLGFRPMWSKDGVCACLAPTPRGKTALYEVSSGAQ